MAVFHFSLQLVPRAAFAETPPEVLSDAEVDAGQSGDGWWAARQPSAEHLRELRGLFPIDASWSGVEEFLEGDELGSDLRIWRSRLNAPLFAIVFRFSALTENWSALESFLTVARTMDCWLIDDRTRALFPPDREVVLRHYAASRARRFRSNPEKALVEAADALNSEKPAK